MEQSNISKSSDQKLKQLNSSSPVMNPKRHQSKEVNNQSILDQHQLQKLNDEKKFEMRQKIGIIPLT